LDEAEVFDFALQRGVDAKRTQEVGVGPALHIEGRQGAVHGPPDALSERSLSEQQVSAAQVGDRGADGELSSGPEEEAPLDARVAREPIGADPDQAHRIGDHLLQVHTETLVDPGRPRGRGLRRGIGQTGDVGLSGEQLGPGLAFAIAVPHEDAHADGAQIADRHPPREQRR
jgi:hypothetical protein